MVGGGVLRECLLDPEVSEVVSVGRRRAGTTHPKLREIVHTDLADLGPIAGELAGFDACFYCLGISSVGLSEAEYRVITRDYAIAAAKVLLAQSPGLKLVFVSGAGTNKDGRAMWARVKGETESELLALPFGQAFMFRPAFIQPLHGIRSRTLGYRVFYALLAPFYPLWRALLPGLVTTTEQVGRAMLEVVRRGYPKPVLENRDINRVQSGVPASAPPAHV